MSRRRLLRINNSKFSVSALFDPVDRDYTTANKLNVLNQRVRNEFDVINKGMDLRRKCEKAEMQRAQLMIHKQMNRLDKAYEKLNRRTHVAETLQKWDAIHDHHDSHPSTYEQGEGDPLKRGQQLQDYMRTFPRRSSQPQLNNPQRKDEPSATTVKLRRPTSAEQVTSRYAEQHHHGNRPPTRCHRQEIRHHAFAPKPFASRDRQDTGGESLKAKTSTCDDVVADADDVIVKAKNNVSKHRSLVRCAESRDVISNDDVRECPIDEVEHAQNVSSVRVTSAFGVRPTLRRRQSNVDDVRNATSVTQFAARRRSLAANFKAPVNFGKEAPPPSVTSPVESYHDLTSSRYSLMQKRRSHAGFSLAQESPDMMGTVHPQKSLHKLHQTVAEPDYGTWKRHVLTRATNAKLKSVRERSVKSHTFPVLTLHDVHEIQAKVRKSAALKPPPYTSEHAWQNLNTRYLRLTDRNVRDLERVCSDAGYDVTNHPHKAAAVGE